MNLTPAKGTRAAPRRRSRVSLLGALTVVGGGALIGLAPGVAGVPGIVVAHAALDGAAAQGEPVAAEPAPAPAPPAEPPSDQAPAPSAEASAPPADVPATAPLPPPVDPPPAIAAPWPLSAPGPAAATVELELPFAGELPRPPRRSPPPSSRARRRPAATHAPQRGTRARQSRGGGGARADAGAAAGSAALLELPPALVPDFFIRSFAIPPFLLAIYQAAGIEYGVRWEVLAAINEIETDYGRNVGVSTAGALGWMQFMPSTWAQYGVDADGDGRMDPYNPVDAIFAAARYLKSAGADRDLRRAIYAYNHAQWYVESVLMRARRIGGMPGDLVDALAGLSQGRLPVAALARYGSGAPGRRRRGLSVHAAPGAPAVAVQDGEIVKVGRSRRLGRFVMLRDVYANTYTYAHLGSVAAQVALPRDPARAPTAAPPSRAPTADAPPHGPASAGSDRAATTPATKERLFAHPGRARALRAGGRRQMLEAWAPLPLSASLRSHLRGHPGVRRADVVLKRLVPGRRIVAGTVLGRIGTDRHGRSPHMRFEIRPAGRGAPRIDPLPIVRGWRLLDATAIHQRRTWSRLAGDPLAPTLGQVVLMSKHALARRVLANPSIDVYGCGRRDIRAGAVDRRVLATLEYLAASGLAPTVTSLRCGHSRHTATGNLSAHPSGNAVDIANVNGIPILGHQGPGSIADRTVRRLLSLQGTLAPAQIISLMSYEGSATTLALGDHADHIHVGFSIAAGPRADGAVTAAGLRPSQWQTLIDRVGSIENPEVSAGPSPYALDVSRGRGR